jgi:hypothetical protein
MTIPLLGQLNKKQLLILAALVPLAICLVYSIFFLANSLGFSSSVLSNRGLTVAVWGIAVFTILGRLGYELELNVVKGYYRSYIGVALLVAICSMAVGVCAVILGLVGTVALVPISVLLLGMCVIFSSDFFGVNLLPFSLRLLFGSLIIGLVVVLVGFLI